MFGLCQEFDCLEPSWPFLEFRYGPVDDAPIVSPQRIAREAVSKWLS